jgi:ArsR family transcriptional regulator, arsenate/arsenite/antimonite-responsive transcriptional repressor
LIYIPVKECSADVKLVQIYQCLCDETRLRLLHLLLQGPLCVCHFQTVLGEPQVKISKHLGYLKTRGLVAAKREGNWMIYALPAERARSAELKANLACLQDCAAENAVFKRDLARLRKLDLACAPAPVAAACGPRKGCCR